MNYDIKRRIQMLESNIALYDNTPRLQTDKKMMSVYGEWIEELEELLIIVLKEDEDE